MRPVVAHPYTSLVRDKAILLSTQNMTCCSYHRIKSHITCCSYHRIKSESLPPGSAAPTGQAAAAHFTYRASQVAGIDSCSPQIPGQILCVTGEEIEGRAVGVTKRSQEQRGVMRHAFYHACPSLRTSTDCLLRAKRHALKHPCPSLRSCAERNKRCVDPVGKLALGTASE